jgi:hypothetical protein
MTKATVLNTAGYLENLPAWERPHCWILQVFGGLGSCHTLLDLHLGDDLCDLITYFLCTLSKTLFHCPYKRNTFVIAWRRPQIVQFNADIRLSTLTPQFSALKSVCIYMNCFTRRI